MPIRQDQEGAPCCNSAPPANSALSSGLRARIEHPPLAEDQRRGQPDPLILPQMAQRGVLMPGIGTVVSVITKSPEFAGCFRVRIKRQRVSRVASFEGFRTKHPGVQLSAFRIHPKKNPARCMAGKSTRLNTSRPVCPCITNSAPVSVDN